MDDRYPVTLKLSPKEYEKMCEICSAYFNIPIESMCRFDIENYLHNIINDLVCRGHAERQVNE